MEIGNVYIVKELSSGQTRKIKLSEKINEIYNVEFLDVENKPKKTYLINKFKSEFKIIETIGLEIPF
jgi:6-phosphogluconolactonase (cycloisomerase 2 family)